MMSFPRYFQGNPVTPAADQGVLSRGDLSTAVSMCCLSEHPWDCFCGFHSFVQNSPQKDLILYHRKINRHYFQKIYFSVDRISSDSPYKNERSSFTLSYSQSACLNTVVNSIMWVLELFSD
jgi:hypothetical protein